MRLNVDGLSRRRAPRPLRKYGIIEVERSGGALQCDDGKMPMATHAGNFQFQPHAGHALDQRHRLGARGSPWPARPRLETRQAIGRTMAMVDLVGRPAGEGGVGSLCVVQRSLRTPTEPSFGNSCIDGIRGLAFGSAFTTRSASRTALYFAAT